MKGFESGGFGGQRLRLLMDRRPGTGSTHTAQSTAQMLFEIVALVALVDRQRT
jgi:hypothetical protein